MAASYMKRLSHFVHSAIYRSPVVFVNKYIIPWEKSIYKKYRKRLGKDKRHKIRIKCENAWDTIEIRSDLYYIMDCRLALNDNEC